MMRDHINAVAKLTEDVSVPNPERDAMVIELAQRCGFRTLKTQRSDRLDFHEVAVWNIKAVLEEAYAKGFAAGSAKTV